MNFCINCGEKLKENADICLNCGRLVNKQQKNNKKIKVPGKGISISGMIIGIIASIWTFFEVVALANVNYFIEFYSDIIETNLDLISFIFGYTILSFIPSIVGFCLSGFGFMKKKSGLNITGIILNSLSLVITLCIISY